MERLDSDGRQRRRNETAKQKRQIAPITNIRPRPVEAARGCARPKPLSGCYPPVTDDALDSPSRRNGGLCTRWTSRPPRGPSISGLKNAETATSEVRFVSPEPSVWRPFVLCGVSTPPLARDCCVRRFITSRQTRMVVKAGVKLVSWSGPAREAEPHNLYLRPMGFNAPGANLMRINMAKMAYAISEDHIP